MADPNAVGEYKYTYAQVTRAFRAWGWAFDTEGVKQARFSRDGIKIGVRRLETITELYSPLVDAAAKDGLTVVEWMKGPKEKKLESNVDEDDLEFFLSSSSSRLGTDDSIRYRRIRAALEKEGTLASWVKVKEQRAGVTAKIPVTSIIENPAPLPPPPVVPLPVKADSEGYTTLDQALAMVNKKQNKLSTTACKIIAVLSDGDITDTNGKATTILYDQMLDPPQNQGSISGMLREMEQASLVWREMPHSKATNKLGLCMPVKLTDMEKQKWLKPEAIAKEVTETTPRPAPVAPFVDDAALPASVFDIPPGSPLWSDPEPEQEMSVTHAIDLLRTEIDKIDQQITEWQVKRESLVYALKVLEGDDQ